MKSLLTICLFLVNCSTTQAVVKKPTYQPKYTTGECVRFNKEVMRKKGKKVDGTVMFIRGFKKHPTKHTWEYVVLIDHPRMDKPYEFTAVIKVFDADTDKVLCKS